MRIEADDLEKVEEFTVLMYDKSSETKSVNESRLELFARMQRPYDAIPTTQGALTQHVRRAVYQAGYVWSQSLVKIQSLPPPSDWGWSLTAGEWIPFWTVLDHISSACQACGTAVYGSV